MLTKHNGDHKKPYGTSKTEMLRDARIQKQIERDQVGAAEAGM